MRGTAVQHIQGYIKTIGFEIRLDMDGINPTSLPGEQGWGHEGGGGQEEESGEGRWRLVVPPPP